MLAEDQRLFFNINGYVLLKGVFAPPECDHFAEMALRMKAKSRWGRRDSDHQTVLYGAAWFDHSILDVAFGPKLRPFAEDILGGASRLAESQYLITAPRHSSDKKESSSFRWHRGLAPDYGSFERAGNYHCLFTKAIIYVTGLDPGQQTVVVPGSHRLAMPIQRLERSLDDELIRSVDAHRGDVLLFAETLVHSSPADPPQTERTLLVIAYCAPFLRSWGPETDPPASIAAELTEAEHEFIYGSRRYEFIEGEE